MRTLHLESGFGTMGNREKEIREPTTALRLGTREKARPPNAPSGSDAPEPFEYQVQSHDDRGVHSRLPSAGLTVLITRVFRPWKNASSQRTAGQCCQSYLTAFGVCQLSRRKSKRAEQSGKGKRGVSLGSPSAGSCCRHRRCPCRPLA